MRFPDLSARIDDVCLSPGETAVKNDECTIYIITKNGWVQKYRKEESGWTQTGRNGIVRPLSAEQLLSHILPPLAGKSPAVVRVEADAPIRKRRRLVPQD
jgi:hypothetical protein